MLLSSLAKHDQVIEVEQDFQEVHMPHRLLHKSLEGGWGSSYSLWHSFKLKEYKRTDERRFLLVFLSHGYLIVSTPQVENGEPPASSHRIQNIFNTGRCILIRDGSAV